MDDLVLLIPCFNNEAGLINTLLSIRENVAVLVVDDGSYKKIDSRKLKKNFKQGELFLIRLKSNNGVACALNTGLLWALENDYHYIARLDAGDEVIGNRFYRQYKYLQENPECKLLGCWANFIDKKGQSLFLLKHPVTHDEILKVIHLYNPFIHPTVIFHIDVYKKLGGYPENFPVLEDYAYFFLIVKNFNTANLPEVLLNYAVDDKSQSSIYRRDQAYSKVKLLLFHYDYSLIATIGIVKSILLCFVSRKITINIKKFLWRN